MPVAAPENDLGDYANLVAPRDNGLGDYANLVAPRPQSLTEAVVGTPPARTDLGDYGKLVESKSLTPATEAAAYAPAGMSAADEAAAVQKAEPIWNKQLVNLPSVKAGELDA